MFNLDISVQGLRVHVKKSVAVVIIKFTSSSQAMSESYERFELSPIAA